MPENTAGPSTRPVLSPYREDWPAQAAQLRDQLASRLGPLALGIDHIGSTAIPGMDAKDVLDFQVSVVELDPAALAFSEPLAQLGFRRIPYLQDHIPAGLVDRPENWTKRIWTRREHREGDVNLHLRRVGSPNQRLALLFRDWFRAHPEAVPAYATFKRALAQVTPDTDSYSDIKDPVVDLVMVMAEPWAAASGWQP